MAASRQRGRRLASAGQEAGAALLLLEDIRVATLLLNAARYRGLNRWLGLDKTGANVLTIVALAAMVDATQQQATRINRPKPPAAANVALSAAFTESALRTIGGSTASGAAPASMLLAIALAYKLVGTPTRRAMRGVARSPLRLRTAVMAQAQRLSDAAAAAAAKAREAASAASDGDESTTTPAVTT
jgi:hypothetical protein